MTLGRVMQHQFRGFAGVMRRTETECIKERVRVGILKESWIDHYAVAFGLGRIQEQLEIRTYCHIRPRAGMERLMAEWTVS